MDSNIKRKYFVPGLYQKHRRVPKILNNYDFDSSYLQKPRENFTAKCKLCGKTVRASMRVTTNFVNHMKKLHPSIQSESASSFLSDEKSLSPHTSKNNIGILDSKIVSTLIKCTIPLAVLEMSSFKSLLIQLNPEVSIISRSSINDEIIPSLVDQTKIQINELISQTDSLSLVLDYWSLDETKFVSLYSNQIDQKWNQQTLMLGCQKVTEIDDIIYFVENCLLEFNLKKKIFSLCLTSSTGLALKVIMEKFKSLNCLKFYSCSMLLEMIVNEALKSIPLFSSKNTTVDKMFNNDLNHESGLNDDLISIFKPFNELKSDLEKDSVSISVIYPAFKGLKNHLSFFKKFKASDTALEVEKSLEEKLGYVQSMPIFSVAAMLNPNFGFNWIDEKDHSENEKILLNQFLKEVNIPKQDSLVKDVKINAPKKSYLCLSKTVGGDTEYSNELNSYIMYVKGFGYDENFCLLNFWKSNEKIYPNLSNYVKKILTISIGLTEREKFLEKVIQKMELESNFKILPSILFLKFNN